MALQETKTDLSTAEEAVLDEQDLTSEIGEPATADTEEEGLPDEADSPSEAELLSFLEQLEEPDTEPDDEGDDDEAASRGATKTAKAMLSAVNSVRRRYKRPPLRLDGRLTAAAQDHSRDMARHRKTTHRGSNGSTFAQRIRAKGYPRTAMAENVAAGQKSVKAVVGAWMRSPRHRKTMLSSSYNELGVGYAKNGRWYWTQTFGRR